MAVTTEYMCYHVDSSQHLCYGAGGPVLIHSNVGDLLHSLESPGPVVFVSPKLVALNREGNIVVSYEKGGICLFTINGKLLCDIKHSESVQVVYDVQSIIIIAVPFDDKLYTPSDG